MLTSCDLRHVFIVGVPRSGSTLLYSILITNSKIVGLGESSALTNAILTYYNQYNRTNQRNLTALYSEYIQTSIDDSQFTIDKNLYNIIYCREILEIMAGSKVIHATRNPMDNILSMLRSNLGVGNNFTASVQDAADVIIQEKLLINKLQMVFPERIFTYSYDSLVSNPKVVIKRIFSWLGCFYNDDCLEYYKTKQIIKTASFLQARHPINSGSLGLWRKYSTFLEPARQKILESNLFPSDSLDL